jgi:xanthine dehydrogenase accessory factor
VPALVAALRHDLPYIGALGSKKTQAKRRAALLEAGFGEADLAKVRSPIGLDLGSRRAEDVALAIMAEIVAVTNGAAVSRTMPRAEGVPNDPGASRDRSPEA